MQIFSATLQFESVESNGEAYLLLRSLIEFRLSALLCQIDGP